jgi:hypothetical protein
MSFETDIITKLGPVFGNRIYFDTTPDNWKVSDRLAPFCLVNGTGGSEALYVDNTQHDKLNTVLQFSIWGSKRIAVSEAARTLATTIAAANTSDFIAWPESAAVSDWDDVLKLRGSRQSFSFWYLNQ